MHPTFTTSRRPVQAEPAADPVFQRQVERVCACGPRPVGELLSEILVRVAKVNPGLANHAADRLARSAELKPDVVRDLSADQFPKPLLHVVKR